MVAANKPYLMRLSSQSQITIPKALRAELGLRPGDEVIVNKDKEGGFQITGRRLMTVDEMIGSLPPLPPGIDLETALEEVEAAAMQELWDRWNED